VYTCEIRFFVYKIYTALNLKHDEYISYKQLTGSRDNELNMIDVAFLDWNLRKEHPLMYNTNIISVINYSCNKILFIQLYRVFVSRAYYYSAEHTKRLYRISSFQQPACNKTVASI